MYTYIMQCFTRHDTMRAACRVGRVELRCQAPGVIPSHIPKMEPFTRGLTEDADQAGAPGRVNSGVDNTITITNIQN